MSTAKKLSVNLYDGNNREASRNTLESYKNTLTEELIFGVCSPIGSQKEPFIEKLKYKLEVDYDYEVKMIKLSDFINEDSYKGKYVEPIKEGLSDIYVKYYNKIELGNLIRKEKNGAYLAEKAMEKIYFDRVEEAKQKYAEEKYAEDNTISKDELKENFNPSSTDFRSRRKCYIIDSFKTKDELELFRGVYSDNFYLISIFSSLEDRKKKLQKKGFKSAEIEEIINLDDKQKEIYGQNVRDVFVEGDLFVRSSQKAMLQFESKVSRFLNLIFETEIVTPTIEETAMYKARAAAGNSACLSRQVGACIVDDKNNILSVGWNDVPKFGGNLYFSDDVIDYRCFNGGFCSNDDQKDIVVKNIVETLFTNETINNALSDIENVKNILIDNIRKNSKVKDLIEFSRSVHAEMHAIIQGTLTTGDKVLSSRLFCTTYPCHNCARHIVAAGIKEVYYIEPYVKSLCLTLHDDSMTENESDQEKVKLLIFDGVSPNRYLPFFSNFADRKKNGKLHKVNKKIAKPKLSKSLQALSTLEEQAVLSTNKKNEYGK